MLNVTWVKNGYSSKYWSPGIKFSIYTQFIRPASEYGIQVKILEKSKLDILESAQLNASRILLQLPWDCQFKLLEDSSVWKQCSAETEF
jgi:hypothetical protein